MFRAVFVFLVLAQTVHGGDLGKSLARVLSPENVMRNVAADMQQRARLQRFYGDATGADVSQAMANNFAAQYGQNPTEGTDNLALRQEILQLKNEIATLKLQVTQLQGFCLKVRQILRKDAGVE